MLEHPDLVEIVIVADSPAESSRCASALVEQLDEQGGGQVSRRSSVRGAQSTGDIIQITGGLLTIVVPALKVLFMRGHQAEITIQEGKTKVVVKGLKDIQAYELALRAAGKHEA